MDNEFDNEFAELDSSWIEEFKHFDNEYKNYYAEDISLINVHSIYINNNNEIVKIKKEKLSLKTHGILDKDELLTIIKRNSIFLNIKYSLLSILNFNMNIEPVNLTNFLKNKDTNANIGSLFLHTNNHIDSIKFDKSILMFHDINNLTIIFVEKILKNKKLTKKIPISINKIAIANKKTKKAT